MEEEEEELMQGAVDAEMTTVAQMTERNWNIQLFYTPHKITTPSADTNDDQNHHWGGSYLQNNRRWLHAAVHDGEKIETNVNLFK